MNLPCKKDKCLKYPLCINKISINCELLYDIMIDKYNNLLSTKAKTKLWDSYRNVLPKLLNVKGKMKKDKFGNTISVSISFPSIYSIRW